MKSTLNTTTAIIACVSTGFLFASCSEQGASSHAETPDHEAGHDHDDGHAGHDHAEETPGGGDVSAATGVDAAGDDAAGETLDVAGFRLTVPSGWMMHPPSNSMRLAELHVPNASGEPSVAAVSVAGGGAQMNIDRWVGQFSNASGDVVSSRETRQISGQTVHLVEMSGEYRGMGMQPPQSETMMRAAIVEQASGQHLFIKMTGPNAHMETLGEGWSSLIGSLRTP